MSSSGRAQPPPPLSIGDGVGSDKNAGYFDSPVSGKGKRSSSCSSDFSPGAESPSPLSPRKSSTGSCRKPSSPTVNVYTTCGRHTDQFLFGGRSLSDMARAVWKKN